MSARAFCFTIQNPTFNPADLFNKPLPRSVKYAIWQLESAPTTNTPHIQGYVEFTRAKSRAAFAGLTKATHIHSEGRRGSPRQAAAYCSKPESRLDGPWEIRKENSPISGRNPTGTRTDLIAARDDILMGQTDAQLLDKHPWIVARYPRFISQCRRIARERDQRSQPFPHDLHPWQRELELTLHNSVPERTILWYADPAGGAGKSTIAAHWARQGAFYSRGGKTTDVAYAFKEHLSSHHGSRIAIFDFTRSGKEYVNYDILEQIKDGLVVSNKYESTTLICGRQHLVVFANWPPDTTKLSDDRWDIRQLSV
jgi:hypothetical protein